MSATTVTHADREAAWPYAGFHCLPDRQMRERWFSGYYDNLEQGKAIRAFARHRQSAERGEAWRPIETAPKDGTWFLAYWPVQTFEDRIQTTRWLHGDCRFVDASDFMDHIQPTHWQPLPTPPEAVRTPIEGTSHAD